MNMSFALLVLIAGLIILWKAAEFLVAGAVALAKGIGVSPLVIGLTVVAMGTSAPEVAASIAAAARNAGDIAIGNVYGSNIANLALVGGLCALIRPIRIQHRMLRREIPVMLLAALLLWPFLQNLYLSRTEGVILLGIFAGLILATVYLARKEAVKENSENTADAQAAQKSMIKNLLKIVIGLAGLALGADMSVRGAVFIGERIGLSQAVIGLTIIAIGTSLPELVTSLVAAFRGHHDISIGNLVGSNVFNTLLVTGTAGVIRPFAIVERLAGADYWFMIVVSGVFIVMAMVGKQISRRDGVILFAGYVGYLIYLLGFSAGV